MRIYRKYLKYLTVLLVLLAATAAIVVAAQPASASRQDWNGNRKITAATAVAPATAKTVTTGYFYTCPQALQSKALECTYVQAGPNGVNVLDRTTGTVINWKNLTTVGMGFWTTDTGIGGLYQCGVNGDHYVWAVWWLDTYNILHWAVIPDWYLWTGSIGDWGPLPANWSGTIFYNPNKRAASTGRGYCNNSNWANLGVGG